MQHVEIEEDNKAAGRGGGRRSSKWGSRGLNAEPSTPAAMSVSINNAVVSNIGGWTCGGPHQRRYCPEQSGDSPGGRSNRGGYTAAPPSQGEAPGGFAPRERTRSTAATTRPANRTRYQHGTLANRACAQHARPGEATTAAEMVHTGAAAASEASVVVETTPESQGQEGDLYATVWMPDEQEKAHQGKPGDEVPFVHRLTTGETLSSDKAVVDVEPVQYHCSRCIMGIMVSEGERYGRYMLKTVLDSGSGISIVGEGLRHLQQPFQGITLVHPYEGGPTVYVDFLAAHVMTPWAPVEIRRAVSILPRGDNTLILGSKTLWEKLNTDAMDGLWRARMSSKTRRAPGISSSETLPA